eukprot:EG_transcript_13751
MRLGHAILLCSLTILFLWVQVQFLQDESNSKLTHFIMEGNHTNGVFSDPKICVPAGHIHTEKVVWEDTVRELGGKSIHRFEGPNCTFEYIVASSVYFGGSGLGSQYGVDGVAFTCHWHLAVGGCECCPQPTYMARDGPIHAFHELAVVTQFWAFGYGHWMMEAFPRLAELHAILMARPTVKLLVPEAPFVSPLLALLNISENRLVPHRPPQTVFAELAYIPRAGHCGCTHPSRARRLRKLVLRSPILHSAVAARPSSLVVIDRPPGTDRHVTNLDALIGAIAERIPGLTLQRVQLEKMHVFEQARLFASARVVVGPHGAGLGNAMFMAPGGAIVELMPVGRYNGCYGNFAFAYRLKWYHTPVSYQKAGDGSIHLNATSLARAVALTLEAWNATTDVRPAITVLGEPELHDACSR